MKIYFEEYLSYFKDIWSKLGINQRISLIGFFIFVVSLFVVLALWSNRPDYALLYSKLDQSDAAVIIEKLRDMKVPYQLKDSGRVIYVPSEKVYDLRLELAGEGVPKTKSIGFEIFDKTNFGITDFVQKMNYIRAIQGEIGRTISQLEEVADARVHIVIPNTELFSEDQKHTTASIALTMKPGAVLGNEQINGIRYLTACAVEGLEPKNITIIDQYGNILSKNSDSTSSENLNANQLDLKKNVERYFTNKVQSMLEAALGVNNAIVRVNAELNFEQIEVTEEKFDPESAVVRVEQITSEKSSGRSDKGSAAGTSANLDKKNKNVQQTSGEESNQEKESIKNTYEIDRKVQKVLQTTGDVKKLTAAVFVRKNKDSNGNYIARPQNDLKQLEDVIKNSIGFDVKRNDSVVVKEMVFNDETTIVTNKVNGSGRKDLIVTIVKNASVVIMAIIALTVFGSLIKKFKIEEESVSVSKKAVETRELSEEDIDLSELQVAPGELELRKKSLMYHKAITKVAQESPDNIVQILKSWLQEK